MNTLGGSMDSDSAHLQQYARSGDADAFARLVQAYAGMVFATARRITQDTQLAEDVTQNAFLALARDARHVRTNVIGWLHRTATHRALDVMRSRRRADHRDRAAARAEATADPAIDLATQAEWAELLPVIDQAIADLPADLRLPLVLHFLQSRSRGQVAAELGVDASTVSRRIDRAVESLRTTLRRQGVSATAALPAALGQCGPQATPAALHPALVKIGLSGIGVRRTVMIGTQWAALVAVGIGLIGLIVWAFFLPPQSPKVAAAVPASAPTTRPATPPPAIDLIRDAIRHESWIDSVKSLSIEHESVWRNNPQVLASRAAALKKQFPDLPITPEKFPELRPDDSATQDSFAFDERRVRSLHTNAARGDFNVATWNGVKGYSRTKYGYNGQDNIGILPTVGRSFDPLSYMHWPRASVHDFWWSAPRGTEEELKAFAPIGALWKTLQPESAVRGPIDYHGVWCWVVIFRKQGLDRWYVGTDDHRLYGTTHGYVERDDPHITDAYFRAAAVRGSTARTMDEYSSWQKTRADTLPLEQKQLEYERLTGDANINLGLTEYFPADEQWYGDFREVAPGCWLPFDQHWISRRTEKGITFEDVHKDLKVKAVTVNRPLADALFDFSFDDADGVQVYDRTFSPPLIYKWKKDRTAAEWQTVFDEANKRQADQDARQAALNKLVGQAAPAFGAGEWRNGPPRTWADFKGKVVILDFWAEWCGPCKNDLPALVRLADDPASGIAVIGIHTAGSRSENIDAHLKQFGITYPVYVDTDDGGRGFGALMTAFGVRALPQTFVIGRDGRVAAQGSLGETLPLAQTLARQAATRLTTAP